MYISVIYSLNVYHCIINLLLKIRKVSPTKIYKTQECDDLRLQWQHKRHYILTTVYYTMARSSILHFHSLSHSLDSNLFIETSRCHGVYFMTSLGVIIIILIVTHLLFINYAYFNKSTILHFRSLSHYHNIDSNLFIAADMEFMT